MEDDGMEELLSEAVTLFCEASDTPVSEATVWAHLEKTSQRETTWMCSLQNMILSPVVRKLMQVLIMIINSGITKYRKTTTSGGVSILPSVLHCIVLL